MASERECRRGNESLSRRLFGRLASTQAHRQAGWRAGRQAKKPQNEVWNDLNPDMKALEGACTLALLLRLA